jgi:diguanylate cyclase (GGDEF)-like protein/PAS domain S-box-containing protein
VLVRDITVRKRVIRALERSEGRFRNLFEHSLGLICTHDLDGALISVNPATARALDYSIGDLLGRNLADLMPDDRRHQFASYLKRVRENGSDSGLLPVVARDGSIRIWQYNNMLDTDGDEPFVLGHAQDITERRNYEQRLRELSTIDPLTGSYNRRFLDEHAQSLGASLWGCILVDLDRFKQVNDVYGHERGDEVLIGVAEFLRKHAPSDAIVVRMGGDEFMLVTKDATETSVASLADAMRNDAGGAPIRFTLGCAARKANEPLIETIRRADQALYAARAAARGDGAAEEAR